jgi:hypothetical protein
MPDPVPVVLLAAASLYRHFGFHNPDERRLWRRLSDVARAVGRERVPLADHYCKQRINLRFEPQNAGVFVRRIW